MATDRQVEANRRNSGLSTGPRSTEGKSASRRNAVKHGLAGTSTDVEGLLQAEFDGRRREWAATIGPETDEANYALDRAVAASIRIERCEDAIDALTVSQTARARLTWDDDRKVEAATLLGRLPGDPVLVAAQLASTRHGADLVIATWDRLGEALFAKGDWSEFEASTALDLLGIPTGLRDGRTPLDPPEGTDRSEWLRGVAVGEIARLDRRKAESLDTLDGIDRRQAEVATLVVLSKPAALILRYERDAWRRYRESIRAAKAPAADTADPTRIDPPGARGFESATQPRPIVGPVTRAMVDRVDAIMTGRVRPETPEAMATAIDEFAAVGTDYVARHTARIESERAADLPITATPISSRPLNRHQRRALRAMDRSGV